MSMSKKRAAPKPPQEISNPGPVHQNKENEKVMKTENGHDGEVKPKINENILLKVVLPDQRMNEIQIPITIPLIDLRMQLCGKYKFSPSSYKLEPLDADGHALPFTASSTVASTSAKAVSLQPKLKEPVKIITPKVVEITVRLTIKMSRSQQHVVRVRPNVPITNLLPEILEKIRYKQEKIKFLEFRHPTQVKMSLDMSRSLNDYKIREIFVEDIRVQHNEPEKISIHSVVSSPEKYATKEKDPEKVSSKRGGSKKLKTFFRLSKKSKHAPPPPLSTSGTSQSPNTSPPVQLPVTRAEELKQQPNFTNVNENNSKIRDDAHPEKKKRAAPVKEHETQNEPLHGQVSEKIDDVAKTEMLQKQVSVESKDESVEEESDDVKKSPPVRPTAPPRAKPRLPVPTTRLHATGKKKAPAPPPGHAEMSTPSPRPARPEKPPRKVSVERQRERPEVVERKQSDETDGMYEDITVESVESPIDSPRTDEDSEHFSSEMDNLEDAIYAEVMDVSPDVKDFNKSDKVGEESLSSSLNQEEQDSLQSHDVFENDSDILEESVVHKEASSVSSHEEEANQVYAEIQNKKDVPQEDQTPMEDSQSSKEEDSLDEPSTESSFVIIDAKDIEDAADDVLEKQEDQEAKQEEQKYKQEEQVALQKELPKPVVIEQEERISMDADIPAPETSNDEIQFDEADFPPPQFDDDMEVLEELAETPESVGSVNAAEKVEEPVPEVPDTNESIQISSFCAVKPEIERKTSESSDSEPEFVQPEKPEAKLEDTDNLFTTPSHFDPYFGQNQPKEGNFDFMAAAQQMIDQFNEPFLKNDEEHSAEDEIDGRQENVTSSSKKITVENKKPSSEQANEESDDEEKIQEIEKLREQINRMRMKKARKDAEEEEARKNPYTIVPEKKSTDGAVSIPGAKTFTFVPNQRKKKVVYEDYEAAQSVGINLSQSGEIRGVGVVPDSSEKFDESPKEEKTPSSVSAVVETQVKPTTPPGSTPSFTPVVTEFKKVAPPVVITEKAPEPAKVAVPPKVQDSYVTPPLVIKEKDQEPAKAVVIPKSQGGYVSSAVMRRPKTDNKPFVPTQSELERDPGSSRKSALPNYYKRFLGVKAFQSAAEDAKDRTEKTSASTDTKSEKKIVVNGDVTPIKPLKPEKPKTLFPVTSSTPKLETKQEKRTPSPIKDIKQINDILNNTTSVKELPSPPEENSKPLISMNVVDDNALPPPPEEFLTPSDDKVLPPPFVLPPDSFYSRQSSDSSTTSSKASSPAYSPRSPNIVGFTAAKPFSSPGGAKPKFRPMSAAFKANKTEKMSNI